MNRDAWWFVLLVGGHRVWSMAVLVLPAARCRSVPLRRSCLTVVPVWARAAPGADGGGAAGKRLGSHRK